MFLSICFSVSMGRVTWNDLIWLLGDRMNQYKWVFIYLSINIYLFILTLVFRRLWTGCAGERGSPEWRRQSLTAPTLYTFQRRRRRPNYQDDHRTLCRRRRYGVAYSDSSPPNCRRAFEDRHRRRTESCRPGPRGSLGYPSALSFATTSR